MAGIIVRKASLDITVSTEKGQLCAKEGDPQKKPNLLTP